MPNALTGRVETKQEENMSKSRASTSMDRWHVAVIGCGPAGLTAASLLGQAGHNVILIERWPEPYGLPRLSHIDGETARLIASAGDIDHALRDALPIDNHHYLDADGNILLDLDWKGQQCGFPAHISIFQPEIEDAIYSRAQSLPNVEILRGWEVTQLEQRRDKVVLDTRPWDGSWKAVSDESGHSRRIEADYVIGADGANSFTRRSLGIERHRHGHHERWLNLDSEYVKDLGDRFAITSIWCDPARAHMYMPIGKSRVRFEMRVLPGEETSYWEDINNGLAWLRAQHGIGLDEVRPIRNVVYTFDPAVTDSWKKGRVILVGDAAHTMMPYMGQGACAAVRDGANLAWKLDLVLQGKAAPELLDTYEAERRPHVTQITETSTLLGKVANDDDPEKVAARNARFLSGNEPSLPPFPKVETGVIHTETHGRILVPTGAPTPQGRVRANGREGLMDAVVGGGFLIVSHADPSAHLDAETRGFFGAIGGRWIVVDGSGVGPGRVADLDGVQLEFLQKNGFAAYLRRPDFLMYGAVYDLADLPALLRGLREKLHWQNQAAPAARFQLASF
jgi:3-(3-hydroxy-phenyl)propionate hydroxylase